MFAFGAWRGERSFDWPPDVVFAQLVAVLEHAHFQVTKVDAQLRGVVADSMPRFVFWWFRPHGRFAARVEAAGENGSVVIAEYGPAYVPESDVSQRPYRKGALAILDNVQRALAE